MIEGIPLLIIFILSITFIIVMTGKVKLNAFLVLILAAIGYGILSGMNPVTVVKTTTEGFGNLFTSIGIVIVSGTIIGTILEKSGSTITMANTVLNLIGKTKSALAMTITGAIVSIAVFSDSGFVILSSLNKTLAKKANLSMVTMSLSLSVGLMSTHIFVPPTPGPIAAAANLNADLGLVILFGLIVSIPTIIVGYLWALRCGAKYYLEPSIDIDVTSEKKLPNVFDSFSPIIIPIMLITLKSIADFPYHLFGEGKVLTFIDFIGDPTIALLLGVFLAFRLLPQLNEEYINGWVGEGIKNSALIIMITGAGGAFGAVLKATPIGDFMSTSLAHYNIGIFLPFIIAASLKTAQGSATVALITTSAIISPMLPELGLTSELGRVLAVMATSAGSLIVTHANDSYFWIFCQFSGIDPTTAYKTLSVGTVIQGITSMMFIYLLSLILL